MKTLLCLLILASFAMAQPVWGPYEVFSLGNGFQIQEVFIAAHHDTCEIFLTKTRTGIGLEWDNDASIQQIPFYLDLQTARGFSTELLPHAQSNRHIQDVFADSSGKWCIVVIDYDYFNEQSNLYRLFPNDTTDLFWGAQNDFERVTLHGDSAGLWDCVMKFLDGQTISKSESGYTIVSAFRGCQLIGDIDELWSYSVVHEFDSQFMLDTTYEYCGNSCQVLSNFDWRSGLSLPNNSVAILAYNGADYSLSIVNPLGTSMEYALSCLPSTPARSKLCLNLNGQLLIPNDQQIVRIDTTGVCTPFGTLDVGHYLESPAFHPRYGFAELQVSATQLLLARIDTVGQEVQPIGILYETVDEHYIMDTDITITDNGQVVAVWSEYSDLGAGPRELKIAWTEWDTFLDTPEQGVPSVPRELTLSAFPNPFNSAVTIQYDLPNAGKIELLIYDLQGRLVESLQNEFTPSGSHSFAWSPNGLASGVYFVRLSAGNLVKSDKLLYLK